MTNTNEPTEKSIRTRAIEWRERQLANLPTTHHDDPSGEWSAKEKRKWVAGLRASLEAQIRRISALPESASHDEVMYAAYVQYP